jgi:hypothetical protein
MNSIKWPVLRSALSTFLWMFLVIIALGSVRKLHEVGQPIGDLVIDAIGVAAVFAAIVHVGQMRRGNTHD